MPGGVRRTETKLVRGGQYLDVGGERGVPHDHGPTLGPGVGERQLHVMHILGIQMRLVLAKKRSKEGGHVTSVYLRL